MIALLLYAFAVPAATGFLLVAAFSRSDADIGVFERLFLGFGVGTGLLTFEMFILGLLGVPFSVAAISAAQLATAVIPAYFLYRSRTPLRAMFGQTASRPGATRERASTLKRLLVLIIIVWIAAKALFILYEGFSLPEHTSDSWAQWSSAAKFFFYERGLALDPSNEHFFGRDYLKVQRYPLNVPLMQVWLSLCIGQAHEVYMKSWNALFYVATVGLLFFSLKRRTGLMTALLAAFFLSSVPLLTYHALTAYADLPLSFYVLGAAICFQSVLDRLKEGRINDARGMVALMGLCIALSVWTKMEGLFFAAAFSAFLALSYFVKKAHLKHLVPYLVPPVVVAALWYGFLLTIGVTVDYGEGRMIGETLTEGIHAQVLPVILDQALFSANFNLIVPFLALLAALGYRRIVRSDLRYQYGTLLSVTTAYLILYLGTDAYRFVMTLTALNRNIVTMVPMMYYIAALTAKTVLHDGAEPAMSPAGNRDAGSHTS